MAPPATAAPRPPAVPTLPVSLLGRAPRFPNTVSAAPDPEALELYSSFRAPGNVFKVCRRPGDPPVLKAPQLPQTARAVRSEAYRRPHIPKLPMRETSLVKKGVETPGPGTYRIEGSFAAAAKQKTDLFDVFDSARAKHVTSSKGTMARTSREYLHAARLAESRGATGPLGPGAYETPPTLGRPSFSRDGARGFGGASANRSEWTRACAGSTTEAVPHSYGRLRDSWAKDSFNKVLAKAANDAHRSRIPSSLR